MVEKINSLSPHGLRFGIWVFLAIEGSIREALSEAERAWLYNHVSPSMQQVMAFAHAHNLNAELLHTLAASALTEGCVDPTQTIGFDPSAGIHTHLRHVPNPHKLDGTVPKTARSVRRFDLIPRYDDTKNSCWVDQMVVSTFQLQVGNTRSDMIAEQFRTPASKAISRIITSNRDIFAIQDREPDHEDGNGQLAEAQRIMTQKALDRARDNLYEWCFGEGQIQSVKGEKGRFQSMPEAMQMLWNGTNQFAFAYAEAHVCSDNIVKSLGPLVVSQSSRVEIVEYTEHDNLNKLVNDNFSGVTMIRSQALPCKPECLSPSQVHLHLLIGRPPPTLCVVLQTRDRKRDSQVSRRLLRKFGTGSHDVEWPQIFEDRARTFRCNYSLIGCLILTGDHWSSRWQKDGQVRDFDSRIYNGPTPVPRACKSWSTGLRKKSMIEVMFFRINGHDSDE